MKLTLFLSLLVATLVASCAAPVDVPAGRDTTDRNGNVVPLEVTPTKLDFGTLETSGRSDTMDFTIRNPSSTRAARIDSIVLLTGTRGYSVSGEFRGRELGPNQSMSITVRFDPVEAGWPLQDTVLIFGPGNPRVELTGRGPAIWVEDCSFSQTQVGTMIDTIVDVVNASNEPCVVQALTLNGPDAAEFALVPGGGGPFPLTIPARSRRPFTIRFTPSRPGSFTAMLIGQIVGVGDKDTIGIVSGVALP